MPPLFQWSVPLVAGGLCMLAAPLSMFGAPAADEPLVSSSRQLALYVLLYYPSAIAMLFIASRLHRWTTRKVNRPRLDYKYLLAGNLCLAIAGLALVVALMMAIGT